MHEENFFNNVNENSNETVDGECGQT